jgi:arsenate reductase-like glutaredoxin family protein
LRSKGIEVDEVNYAKSGLDEATVRRIVAAAGSVAPLVNTRHALARERGWAERPPDIETFLRAVVHDDRVLRRPILIRGRKTLVGYDKASRGAWDELVP